MRITVSSWGDEVGLVGAPAKGALTIGTLRIANPVAYFTSTGLVETDGILGNALFYDRYAIVIDLQRNRFGVWSTDRNARSVLQHVNASHPCILLLT